MPITIGSPVGGSIVRKSRPSSTGAASVPGAVSSSAGASVDSTAESVVVLIGASVDTTVSGGASVPPAAVSALDESEPELHDANTTPATTAQTRPSANGLWCDIAPPGSDT